MSDISTTDDSWLIDLIYKPDTDDKRPHAAEISLHLAYIGEILAEAELIEASALEMHPTRPHIETRASAGPTKEPT